MWIGREGEQGRARGRARKREEIERERGSLRER